MSNSEVTYLLGKILGLSFSENHDWVEEKLKDPELDWIVFTQQANRYLILPTIYYELNTAKFLDYLPDELKDHLTQIFTLSTKRNKLIQEQIAHVVSQLNEEGIEPVLLKGGGNLMEGLYPHPGVRIMTDVDMLVGDEDFLKAAETLKKDGYKTEIEFDDIYTSIEQAKDYPRLFKPDALVDIEIHRLPVATEFKKHFGYEEAVKNLKRFDDEGRFAVLSYENNVLLNFIHSQLTDKAHLFKYVNLKNMYDLWMMSQKTDVEKVFYEFGFYTNEALAYWGATKQLFGESTLTGTKIGLAGKKYLDKAMFYVDNPEQYQKDKSRKYLLWRIGYSYIKFPLSTVFNSANRKLLLKKMFRKSWYQKHLESFRRRM